MNVIINNLQISVEFDGIDQYIKKASRLSGISTDELKIIKILSKELDISDKEQFHYIISLAVHVPDNFKNTQKFPEYIENRDLIKKTISSETRPIIIGFGPAGMFAALTLLEYGLKPVIFERGKKIEDRSRDVQKFIKEKRLDPDSNIQFGEGGAGSFSDGKLFSRRDKNTDVVKKVLETFVKFGAPGEIRYISKPHLGTDVLCRIVVNIRNYIVEQGGEIHYSSKMTGLLITKGKACGVIINDSLEYQSSAIYFAIGHSARDTFELIYKNGITVEQKPISVGVRMEHPAALISSIRYGDKYKDFRNIGAAAYSLNYTDHKNKRGAYTFCMCPGGEILNASSEEGLLVLNGMSNAARSSAFSNAAIVVSCHTADYNSSHPLAGIEFQKEIEHRTFQKGRGTWAVPAQNLMDFMNNRISDDLNENSYQMGTVSSNLKELFPDFINEMLLAAFNHWKQAEPLFIGPKAVLLGSETRTTSPVKIKRDHNFESVNIRNLYPIGEGSGYSSGITSSATDAINAVNINCEKINQ